MKNIFKSRSWVDSIRLLIIVLISIMFFKLMDNSDPFYQGIGSKIGALTSTTKPFIFAALLAYIVSPIVDVFDKHISSKLPFLKKREGARRTINTLLVYLLIISLIATTFVYILPEIVSSVVDLFESAPSIFSGLQSTMIEFNNSLYGNDLDVISLKIGEMLINLFDTIGEKASGIVNTIIVGAIDFTTSTLLIIYSLIVSIYFVVSKDMWNKGLRKVITSLFGRKSGVKYDIFWRRMNRTFIKFVLGKAIASLILGIIGFIGLTIIKSPYAVLISVIFGVTNMIPYFGPFIGELVGVVLVALVNPMLSIVVLILLFGIQQIDAFILTPKLVGDALKISPVWIMFSIILGGKLFGITGMFFGAPFMAVIIEIIDYRLEKRLKRQSIAKPDKLLL